MNNKNFPLVTIIIPVLNERKYIKNFLKDILNQDYPKDNIEIFIIDGGSKDGTIDILNKFLLQNQSLRAVLLIEPDKNVASAVNIGAKKANGKIIMKMDAHTEYAPDYILKCVEYLRREDIDCVGGPMRPIGDNYISTTISLSYRTSFGTGGGKFHNINYQGYADTVYLGAYKKNTFEKLGGWDEKIMDTDDDDFNYRLRKAGGKIFLTPEIKSHYHVRGSLKKLWDQYFRYGYSQVSFIKKHRAFISPLNFIPSLFVLGVAISFLLSFFYNFFGTTLFLVLISYFVFSFLISLKLSFRNGFKYFLLLPLTFLILHLSYGVGFLKGTIKWLMK